MHWLIEPPIDRWQLQPSAPDPTTRAPLAQRSAHHASRLNTGQPPHPATPIIATGHQAWLWHPGILAKDVAMIHAASRLNAGALHLVVDQDTHPALRLELPVIHDRRIAVETIELATTAQDVPTGCQPPADASAIAKTLADTRQRLGATLAVDLTPIEAAFTDLPPSQTLAQQITAAITRLRRPFIDTPIPVLFATDLPTLPPFQSLLDRLLNDARACAQAYNTAAAQRPNAHVATLRVEPDRVEAPLWALQWNKPRQRVFIDLADSPPIFTLDNGQPINPNPQTPSPDHPDRYTPAPKALLMTAVLRRYHCDLFIHGRGGDAYDRVTEDWWQHWLGETLAPMAAVSADLTLNFNAPVNNEQKLRHAQWHRHHLPHNIDRQAPAGAAEIALVKEKRDLLGHMDDDRDRDRRAAAFKRVRQINLALARSHPRLLAEAQERVERARVGLANRRTALKRDWCFAFYEPAGINTDHNK